MSLRQIHNTNSAFYHFIFNDPKLYSLIDKFDKLSDEELIQVISYKLVDSINYNDIIKKISDIENKDDIIFCNILVENIFINYIKYKNDILYEYIDFINNFFKYYVIGFFFESYIDKYKKIINKIKIISESECILKKNNIYKLLVKDFMCQLTVKFFTNLITSYRKQLNINFDTILYT